MQNASECTILQLKSHKFSCGITPNLRGGEGLRRPSPYPTPSALLRLIRGLRPFNRPSMCSSEFFLGNTLNMAVYLTEYRGVRPIRDDFRRGTLYCHCPMGAESPSYAIAHATSIRIA